MSKEPIHSMKLDPWQYRISLNADAPGRVVGPARVQTGPGLNEVLLEDAQGQPVGLLLGFPIDLAGAQRLTAGTHRLGVALEGDPNAFAEAVMEELAGRFLWLCTAGGGVRIYLDATGQVPCVYDVDMRVAASSAYALFEQDADIYEARFDKALHDRLGISGIGWIPGGLTAHEKVQRLLPNHVLTLEDFQVRRHWPLSPVPTATEPDKAINTLIETVQTQIAALVSEDRKIALALTAGRETRMLLGCARAVIREIDCVTVAAVQGAVDMVMAKRIAASEGVTHHVLPLKQADEDGRKVYLRRNGDCIADANASSFPSVLPIADTHVFVGGAGGEVGRGFFWRASDTPTTPLGGAALMGRFGLPSDPRVIAALDAWCNGLKGRSTLEILDLAYIEHRMGPWGGAQFPSDPTLVRFAPLLTRKGVRAMLSLPEGWKRCESMSAAVLRATWPELERYPYNTLGPFRDGLFKVQKILRDPSAILRKLRKQLG